MKNYCIAFLRFSVIMFLCLSSIITYAAKNERQYYKLTAYHFKDAAQEKVLDTYFEYALLPALHRQKVTDVGVFKSLANDTAADKIMYIFMPFKSLEDLQKTELQLNKDAAYHAAGSDYINAAFDKPAYTRMEAVILYAFPLAPKMELPQLRAARSERVYELRSYESATEKIFKNKVQMFNEGGEVSLFKRLNFNAVFYSEAVAGAQMPNLMYMTTFENMEDRNKHWKAFVDDAQWKELSARPEYQKNVQHIDIIFLRPALYSDF